jgi:GT2 family glycosyltransferase
LTSADRLDFLAAPFAPDAAVARSGDAFDLSLPWRILDFGDQAFSPGWWTLACEGEGDADLSGVDVRLASADDPWLMFPGDRAGALRTYFATTRTFRVSLLLSPWPGRVTFRTLALRRLGPAETARLAAGALARLSRRGDAVRRVLHLARTITAGRTVGMQAGAAVPIPEASVARTSASPVHAPGPVLDAEGDVSILRLPGDRLHPRALDLVRAAFARAPAVLAIHADVREAGVITPHPAWDAELAKHADFVGLPLYLRGRMQAVPGSAWEHLRSVVEAHGPGSVLRIPLPLAERDAPLSRAPITLPTPELATPPRVSVIIPTQIRIDLLDLCLQGLAATTAGIPLEVVVVNNGSEDVRLPDVLARARRHFTLKEVLDPGPFNFSRLVNLGVRSATGEVVLLLNDDVVPGRAGWLHRMLHALEDPLTGVVGARLHYPDGSVQHAGVVLGVGGVCGHLWKGLPGEQADRFPVLACPGERRAVTGACLAVRRPVWDEVGGFDAANFPVALNDIDFCLRVRAAGYRVIYRGDAVLVHHESQSRGQDDADMRKQLRLARETGVFLQRWGDLLADDPHGSPAFDLSVEQGVVHRSLRAPPDQA